MNFAIVIHKDPNSDYGVTVPDLPGCFSAGKTLNEAIINAKEAIECHIEGMLIDGESIPTPLPLEIHKLNEEYSGGEWESVDLNYLELKKIAL